MKTERKRDWSEITSKGSAFELLAGMGGAEA